MNFKHQGAAEGGAEAWRMFIALPLPAQQTEAIAELQARLRKGAQFTPCRPAWTAPETIHLTLAFLGNRHAAEAPVLAKILAEACAGTPPLRLEVKGLGVFPDWRHPKVLWVGLRERTHQLEPLRARLVDLLGVRGFSFDDKQFKPHLTIGRFKSFTGTAAFQKIAAAHEDFFQPAASLEEVCLFRSQLKPAGAEHQVLARERLSSD